MKAAKRFMSAWNLMLMRRNENKQKFINERLETLSGNEEIRVDLYVFDCVVGNVNWKREKGDAKWL